MNMSFDSHYNKMQLFQRKALAAGCPSFFKWSHVFACHANEYTRSLIWLLSLA